jgi:hypothetical protein
MTPRPVSIGIHALTSMCLAMRFTDFRIPSSTPSGDDGGGWPVVEVIVYTILLLLY